MNKYEQFGGSSFFTDLVQDFYQRISTDELLRPMYPEGDLGPAERRLRLFLEQYWGGPTTYSEERGHPRLRMRHAPFVIDEAAKDRWLDLMSQSLAKTAPDHNMAQQDRDELWRYLTMAANSMINSVG